MSARSSWSGAITFAGFPIPVKAYNLTSTTKDQGFKTLCPCHGEPIKQNNVCATAGTVVTSDVARKGVELAKDSYHMLDAQAVEQINGVGKTIALEPERICPLDTLPLHMATGGYRLVADSKAGADKPVAILYRTLLKTGQAIVTRWTPRAGSRDHIVALWAHPTEGLIANTLPFEHQQTNAPKGNACDMAVADAEMAMFEQALTTLYVAGPYAAADFVSDHNARRAKAIEAAVAGQPVAASGEATAAPVPDLMAALAASLAAAQSTPNGKEAVAA